MRFEILGRKDPPAALALAKGPTAIPDFQGSDYDRRYKEWRDYALNIPWWRVPRGSSEEARRLARREIEDEVQARWGICTKAQTDRIRASIDRERDEYLAKERSPTPPTEYYPSDLESDWDNPEEDAPLSPPNSPRPKNPFSKGNFLSATETLLKRDSALYDMYGFDKFENWKNYMLSGKAWPPVAPSHPGKRPSCTDELGIKRKREEDIVESVEQEPAMKKTRRLTGRARTKKDEPGTIHLQRIMRSQAGQFSTFFELSESGTARTLDSHAVAKSRPPNVRSACRVRKRRR